MAATGEAPEPATPADAPAAEGTSADGGAASLDDMAAIIAESGEPEAEEGAPAEPTKEPAEGEEKPKDGEEPAKEEKPADAAAKDADKTPEALRAGFTALARDRRKLQEREARAKATMTEAEAFRSKAASFDAVVKRLHEDPIGLLREAGGDDLINKALDGVIASEKSPAEREVEKLRNDLAKRDADAKARETNQLVSNWRAGIVRDVQAAGDKYDLVNALGQQEAVIEAITQYHIKYNGAVLPTDVAAQAVEDALAKGLEKSKKFGARGAVKPPVTATPSRKTGATTLSSVASGDVPQSANGYPADDDARYEAVLKEMRAAGQLT